MDYDYYLSSGPIRLLLCEEPSSSHYVSGTASHQEANMCLALSLTTVIFKNTLKTEINHNTASHELYKISHSKTLLKILQRQTVPQVTHF